jgi:2-amino-4-hydroxy-6-hydroxymethyldihydropteridine diphosphokinase
VIPGSRSAAAPTDIALAEIALGLGSNLGSRRENLDIACQALIADVFVVADGHQDCSHPIRRSSIYETAALLLPDSPKTWDIPYLNMVVRGFTRLAAAELLKRTQAIELTLGRRESPRWSPRVIDIDILVYGEHSYTEPGLTIPHPQILNRAFVLEPLKEVWPDLSLQGLTISSLIQSPDPSILGIYPS